MDEKATIARKKHDWPMEKCGPLTVVLSPALKEISWLVHVFTTRLGGESPQPLDSFNLGRHWHSDESRLDAMRNRKTLCDLLSLDAQKLAVPGQQHTSNIHVLESDMSEPGPFHFPGIDAVATSTPGQPVLLHFADCVPVMLVDRKNKKLCVIHAGWRGTAGSIVKKSVNLMVQQLKSNPGDITAAIGPAIGSCCYATGTEVVEQLNATVEGGTSLVQYKDGTAYPDLQAFNAMQLIEAGVENIDVSNWCTACHPELFYSHRQSGGQTGRQGALACLS